MGWATYVDSRVEQLENDLRQLAPSHRTSSEYIATWAGVRDARILAGLEKVPPDISPVWLENAAEPSEAVKPKNKEWNWLTGVCTERAYAALHRADAAFLGLGPDTIIRKRAAEMLNELPTCGLHPGDLRLPGFREDLTRITGTLDHVSSNDRLILQEISVAIDRASDAAHYRARNFRNLLLGTALGLFLVYLALAFADWLQPSFFSLCTQGTSGQPASCPLGGSSPGQGDVLLLGLAGMVGGSVGALPLLQDVKVGSGPFTPAVAQALLKLPAGAVISLVGLFALQHGVLDILKPQAGTALVAWAILFGFAQQGVTRAIDKRANGILSPLQAPPGGRAGSPTPAPSPTPTTGGAT